MSFAVQNLAVFIELLKNQPAIFSQENFTELEELIAPIPDDVDKISIAIAGWYQKHPKILNSQLELLKEYSNNSDSSLKAPGKERANKNIPEYELDKKTILNEIQQSSSSAKKTEKQNPNS
ncbi:hypothetical protein VB620_10895 [Nodularia harveyana UHCC-0300]|uniref:Uncharacterized protein n=1 Tax=Nodularia harveyana UHCC-0300 TaxID=2974287 RepID=A0ABU5UE89_9CYAN|nr:hypothetical protein [Nodularia harveyana]MEA5581843.1 hypothetical protein [Nodularia harveyana UHCC-0300]